MVCFRIYMSLMDEAQIMHKLLKSIAFGALPILLFSSTLNASHQPQPFAPEELVSFCKGRLGCIHSVKKDDLLSLDAAQLIDGNIGRFNATLYMNYALDLEKITDGLINRISQLKKIKYIYFRVMDGDFHRLLSIVHPANLTRIHIFDVGNNNHLSVLKRFNKLDNLRFGWGVKDEGMEHLQNLKITYLGLTGNKGVTDASVDSIIQITTLEEIALKGTSITKMGVAKIRIAFSDAEIHY